jgi:hypothetical protein
MNQLAVRISNLEHKVATVQSSQAAEPSASAPEHLKDKRKE